MISALGGCTIGVAQLEPDAVAYFLSFEDSVAEEHRHSSLDSLAEPPGTRWSQEAQALRDPSFLG